MPRLRKLTHMCSRTISGTAYRFRHGSTLCSPTVEKILCRSLFSKRSHIGNLRQIRKQGKGRSSKRKGNRRCPFLFAPAAGAATLPPSADGESPAEVQRKTLRPERANTLTQFARPGQPVQKRSRPLGANTLTQFACPGFPVQEKGEDAKSNGETAANFVYCYKIAQNRSVLLEMTGAKC